MAFAANQSPQPQAEPTQPPYAPSWLDRLLDAIEGLPGPSTLAHLSIGLAFVLLMYFEPWLMGASSPWTPVEKIYWGAMLGAQLWVAGYLRRVAGSAFDAFRPALRLPEPDVARLRYELTVIPAVPALAVVALAVVLSVASLVVNPAATGTVALTGMLLVGAFVLQAVVTALMLVLLLQLTRQMWHIRRTMARSAVVDVFRPGPLHAFSRLTSRTGVILLALTGSSLLVLPASFLTEEAFVITWLPYLVVPPLIATAAFVVPLYGMHGRLIAEKERQQGQTEERLQGLFDEINRDVDARDLASADALNKSLMSLLQQRDVLAKLPTWPWSTATLRGFVTAIFLPLALFLIQRVLSQLV